MPDAARPSDDPEAWDEVRLLGGRARLRQRRDGYRAGLDAALLAAAVCARPGETVVEAGCGAGGALVQAALRAPSARFVGVERDPAALALAGANIALNGLSGRVEACAGDIDAGFAATRLPRADAVFANPPFFDDPSALRPPTPARQAAWMAEGGLEAWTRFLLAAVRDGGAITIVHRADRLGDLLALLGEKAGSFQVRPVHPFADAPAKRVLVRARRLGRAPLRLLPPLVLHDAATAAAPLPSEVLAGDADLRWLG
ncbi:MAG: methyltransferase domain-containing protein [Caulobacteraceae bacterium]|nr:methyltransferase domain-containing protein [Caulobacter sp.]